MTDLVSLAARELSESSGWLPLVAFAAGLATSLGPCVAPRFVAVVGLAAASPRRERGQRLAAFACGLCGGYVLLVTSAALIARLAAWSSQIDVVLAGAFAVAAIHAARERPGHACERPPAGSRAKSFAIGVSLALIGSPCCAPIVMFLAGSASLTAGAPQLALAGAAFAAGHVMPVVFAGACAGEFARRLHHPVLAHARATVVAGLFLGLSAYYGLMA